jgi:2-polyprenyl-3-methyl-5-hydroxy-6-metoxy-1,4-benzoquinol methylase
MSNLYNVYMTDEEKQIAYHQVGQTLYEYVYKCRCCDSEFLLPVLDLGKQPLANSYRHDPHENQTAYPLQLNVCMECFHGQLSIVVNPDFLFKDYAYVSGTSQTLRDYFDWFAKWVTDSRPTGKVLDIACNDGSQLDSFKKLGWDTYGVDPAENIVPLAREKGHKVVLAYWTDTFNEGEFQKFDIILAQNVFAHTHDILSFLKACKKVMHENTKLYIQTSQANMIENGEFDTMYHEHLSFFNLMSMQTIVERAGLFLNNVTKPPIHGTSYVFEIGLTQQFGNLTHIAIDEAQRGLYSPHPYIRFAKKASTTIQKIQNHIAAARREGWMVAGYGAAAKFMTVLNYGHFDLDFIIDDAPLKQGKYTPGRNTLILSSTQIPSNPTNHHPILWIIGAWNFKDEIIKRIKVKRPNHRDYFLTYFPTVEMTDR